MDTLVEFLDFIVKIGLIDMYQAEKIRLLIDSYKQRDTLAAQREADLQKQLVDALANDAADDQEIATALAKLAELEAKVVELQSELESEQAEDTVVEDLLNNALAEIGVSTEEPPVE